MQCKGSNNVTGIYVYILNLAEHNRSKRDGFLTIQVLKTTQMKTFEFNNCMQTLVEDLTDLVENGFLLPNGLKANVRFCQYRYTPQIKESAKLWLSHLYNNTSFLMNTS